MLNINPADVIAVLKTMIPQLVILGVVLLAAIIATLSVIKKTEPVRKFVRKQAWLAFLLTVVIVISNILLVPMYSMVNMAMGGGTISDEAIEEAKALCTEIAEEGIVMLKNDAQALPLAEGSKVNVFGWS
ncbi:MAG: beta-glucosidase, partial [Butyrivibrio sp.]|nr:beta-glucosidase [Butyrivibrio sp.]